MKKILVLILIGLITLSIYSVFMNFFSSWQYNQQVQALQNDYSTDDSINLKNLSSHQIPSPLRDYLALLHL